MTKTIINVIKSNTSDKRYLERFLHKKCRDGCNPILYAAFRGNIELIELLIENGVNYLELSNKGLNVLHMAAQGDRPEVLVYFKEKYNLDISAKDNNGSTPLHWACYMGCQNAFSFLLSWTDNVNIKENLGYTPFHLAVYSGRIII